MQNFTILYLVMTTISLHSPTPLHTYGKVHRYARKCLRARMHTTQQHQLESVAMTSVSFFLCTQIDRQTDRQTDTNTPTYTRTHNPESTAMTGGSFFLCKHTHTHTHTRTRTHTDHTHTHTHMQTPTPTRTRTPTQT